jgi:uncharacterized protein (DUF362 family)
MSDSQAPSRHLLTRRNFLKAATAGVGLTATAGQGLNHAARDYYPLAAQARVSILHAASYTRNLGDLLRQGMKNHTLDVRGKRVVLKPNLVEYHTAHRINTHPLLVVAAVDCFRSLGASEVVIADGPGHQRDTEMLLDLSGLGDVARSERLRFVDLNTDSLHRVPTATRFTELRELWLPETILNADVVVSMPKLKTHHWAGVTLSLKNLFGVIPSVRYGWPKNVLHWHGINQSIVDIATTVRPAFAIIDGIEGMEGNGPLHGETVSAQVIVMSENLAAADATAARLMGIDPLRVVHLDLMRGLGEPVAARRIIQTGERLADYRREFRLLDEFAHLRG